MEEKNYFKELFSVNVSDKIEKKNGLSYVSWAYAWAEVKKLYPNANYKVYENSDGCIYFSDGRTAWVKTGVIVNDIEHIEYLPIMDYSNKSIPLEKITSFDVNKAIQRSLTKACARHGLGLYVYAGEDLPEETPKEKKNAKQSDNNDSDLPFENIGNTAKNVIKKTTENFMKVHEDNIATLELLRNEIDNMLFNLGNEDLTQAYGYYAKIYKKNSFEELNEKELAEIKERLKSKLEKRA